MRGRCWRSIIDPVTSYGLRRPERESFRATRDARGQWTTYTYDAASRETERRYQDGTRCTFTYDAAGNRRTAEDSRGTTTYAYDTLNRVTLVYDPHGEAVDYTYDELGRRETMTDPDSGVTTYTYTDAGELRTLMNPQGEVTTWTYDAAGRPTLKELDNGTIASMAYNAAGWQTAVVNLDSMSTTISAFSYAFDRVGNRTSVIEEDGSYRNWTYDCKDQLLGDYGFLASAVGWCRLTIPQWSQLSVDDWNTLPVDATPDLSRAFAYDKTGNRILLTDDGSLTTSTYDAANRLLTADDEATGVTTYTWDAGGNQLTVEQPSGDLVTNTWDGENRLVQIEHADSTITTYAYNTDSLRVEKDDGVDVTRLVLDGKHVLVETDDMGVTEAAYTLNPQPHAHVVSQHRDAASSFFHFDGISNTTELTDDTETVTDEYRFSAWGRSLTSSGTTTNTQQYKGKLSSYRHESDFIATDLRDYRPDEGRFPSEDPAEDGLNSYQYVQNNPVNNVDPSGLEKVEVDDDGTVWVYPESWWFGIDYDDSRIEVGRLVEYTTTSVTGRSEGTKYHVILTGETRVGIDGKEYPIILHYGHFDNFVRSYDFINIRPEHVSAYINEEGFSLNRSQKHVNRSSGGFERTQMDQFVRSYTFFTAYADFGDAVVDEVAIRTLTAGTLGGLAGTLKLVRRGKRAASDASRATRATANLTARLEANAARHLAQMEAKAGSRAHFFSRHGAQTTIEQQYVRATTGLTPDGFAGRAVDSSRFLGHRAQLNAVQAAEDIHRRTGRRSFSFDAGYTVGEGFTRGGGELIRTSNVQAVFDGRGNLRTLFPLLSPLP